MADKPIKLSTSSFRDVPICELCLEDALKAGATKSEKLKPQDFQETSIRFCVDGLLDWYATYADDYLGGYLRTVIRDVSWQWASFCETDPTLVSARVNFAKLRTEIAEQSAYVDLMKRIKASIRIKEFGYSDRPFNLSLPTPAVGVIAKTGSALGIQFRRFFQVGLGWSLSTNSRGLYADWLASIHLPLFNAVMGWAAEKAEDLEEVRGIIRYRQEKRKGEK